MRALGIITAWLLCASLCDGYRILGIFPFQAKSHFMMFEQLMKGLAKRGHQVDVISTFPLKKPFPNYTDLIVFENSGITLVNNLSYGLIKELMVDTSTVETVATMAGNIVCKNLEDPRILNLVKNPPKDPPYDLVFIEIFGAHCFGIISHLLNVPMVGASSSVMYTWSHDIIANPENLAFVPNNLLIHVGPMNFWQRLYNTVDAVHQKFVFNRITDEQTEIIRRLFGEDSPSVRELESRVAMILQNSHFSINGIKPTTPALIEVGGLHVQDDGVEIPKDLKKWLDDSEDGFVYFSFGSMVKVESFPAEVLSVFYKSLGKISPVRVLMKVAKPEELPANLPKNIRTSPWIPQLQVLKHRNVRAFITHGGLMGTQEAIQCGVPMIAIPLFGDQFVNVDTYVYKKIALKLDFKKLTEQEMDDALNAILKNPLYRETARSLSRQFLDRPLNAIDTAVYWTEYIIKYGSDALKSPAMDLRWWQLALLDVYVFLLLVGIIAISIVLLIIRTALKFISGNVDTSVSRSKKLN